MRQSDSLQLTQIQLNKEGEKLIPYSKRCEQAVERILSSRSWTPVQRNWIDRLGKQLVLEVIIDDDFVNNRFAEHGGVKTLEKVMGEPINNLIERIKDAIWPTVS